MLSAKKFKDLCSQRKMSVEHLAGSLSRGGFDVPSASSAIKNWQHGLYKPEPSSEDMNFLAEALGVETNDIAEWRSSHRYAPMSAQKARLVTGLVAGRSVQEAIDILKFTGKRAASFISKVLASAISDAAEQAADVDRLYISEAKVDNAGRRIGTKTWIAKDRGKAHPIHKHACHIYITVTEG